MYQINSKPPLYNPMAIQSMRDELTYVGFKEMLTQEDVITNLSRKDDRTKLVFINSVCGCSAGSARPGVALALQNKKIPHDLLTSFAGNDRDSVDMIREEYLSEYSASSPAMAIIQDGETIYYMGREQILNKSPEEIADILVTQFNSIDSKDGPSISEDKYKELVYSISCGSKIELNKN